MPMDPKEKQLHALRESLNVSPENVPLRRMVAESLLELKQYDDAEQEAKMALQYDNDDTGCKAVLAQVYLHKGKVSMGLVLTEDVLADTQDDAEIWLLHAKLMQRAGNEAEAQQSFQKAVALDPTLRESGLDDVASSDTDTPESPTRMRAAATTGNASQQLVEDTFSKYPLELPPHSERPPVNERDPELPGFVMEKPPFGFDAVGGMASVKDDVRMKIILPSTNQELYSMYGKKAGGGILLYGPPGCGKTHIARATAGEIEAKFISIGLHDILDMWVGNSEKQLHEVFEYARNNKPCVLFFDEVDALAASRTDMRNSASRHTINQFLAELDGVDASNDGVLVLAATNAPWHLDSAFRRPGRFDEVIFVPPPDAEARVKILEIFLADKPTERVDFAKIASKAREFSGADLRGLVDRVIEEKLRLAMKTGTPEPIRTKDLLAGLKRQKSSTQEWLATARNYAAFANEGGVYDDIKAYLNIK
jgi:transitional endoplasmic reticulum ATPase